jgi:RNA polymerase sigma-70 factor (ECF subfamily)
MNAPLAAARGDDAALRELVQAYHDRVYRFGVRVCRDRFDAEDAVQDQGALSWLMSVVKHACLRMLRPFVRERRALGERVDEAEVASDVDPHAALERYELVRAVHAAIAQLERPYREVLVLRDIEGLSGEATAAALGLELATMKTRLHRARSLLRDAILGGGDVRK